MSTKMAPEAVPTAMQPENMATALLAPNACRALQQGLEKVGRVWRVNPGIHAMQTRRKLKKLMWMSLVMTTIMYSLGWATEAVQGPR